MHNSATVTFSLVTISHMLETVATSRNMLSRSLFSTLTKNKDGFHGSLRVVVEIAILLKLIDKVSLCQRRTNCLVLSSV